MAELLVAFPKGDRTTASDRLSDAVRLAEQVGLGSNPRTETARGATVFVTSSSALPLARALRRGLNPASVREFIARGAPVAPSAMFEGFSRLNVGEHLVVENGGARVDRHWHHPRELQEWSFDRTAEEAASVITDRIGRYAAAGRVIADLTSGYDSRLLASAADCAGNDEDWRRKEKYILRVATLEQLCRELDFEPDSGFVYR
jgi:hypothetical protein